MKERASGSKPSDQQGIEQVFRAELDILLASWVCREVRDILKGRENFAMQFGPWRETEEIFVPRDTRFFV